MNYLSWLSENIIDVIQVISYLFLAANIFVRLTPTPADNLILEKLYSIFKLLTVTQIVGSANNNDGDSQENT